MFSWSNKKIFLASILGILFLIYSLLFINMFRFQWFPNTDVNQNYLFANNIVEKGKLLISGSLNEEIKETQIFGPRGTVIKENGELAPTSMIGYILSISSLKLINPYFVYLSNSLFAIVAIFFLFKIAKITIGERDSAITAMILFGLSGPLLYLVSTPFNNMFSTMFFFAGLYYLLACFNENLTKAKMAKFLWLFSIFLVAGIWARYELFIFYLPVVLVLFLTKKPREILFSFNKKPIIFFIALSAIAFFGANYAIYDNLLGFLRPGKILNNYELFTKSFNEGSVLARIFHIDTKLISMNIYNQLIHVNPVIVLLGFLSFLTVRKKNPVFICLILIVLFQIFFYMGKEWSGTGFQGSVGTSFARYMLPSWGLLSILAASFLKDYFSKSKTILLVFFSIIISLNITMHSSMSYVYHYNTINWSRSIQAQLEEKTSPNGVVFVAVSDKYIFPYRTTAIYTSFPENERKEKTVATIKQLLEKNIPVYFMVENGIRKQGEEYLLMFESNNLKTKHLFEDKFYEITK